MVDINVISVDEHSDESDIEEALQDLADEAIQSEMYFVVQVEKQKMFVSDEEEQKKNYNVEAIYDSKEKAREEAIKKNEKSHGDISISYQVREQEINSDVDFDEGGSTIIEIF